MARIRSIKPEFFRHSELFEAERETGLPLRLAFAGLWTAADREGRFKWKVRELKLDCLPHDEIDFSRVLDALWTRGWIVKYAVNCVEFGCIPTWKTHQVINNREKASDLPEITDNNTISTRHPRVIDASVTPLVQVQGEGKGREGKGKECSEAKASAPDGAKVSDAEVFRFGRSILGKGSGGVITDLKKHCRGDLLTTLDLLEQASEKDIPMEWVQGILRGSETAKPSNRELYPPDIYENVL